MLHDSDSPSFAPLPKALLILVVIVGAVSVPIGAWYAYEYSSIAKGSGGYRLRVHIATSRQIKAVRCDPTIDYGEAQAVANSHQAGWDELPRNGRTEPFTGMPFELGIYTWSHTTRSGREFEGGQEEWLVVVAEFADGTRQAKVVEIPDMQISREVRVEFP